MTLENALLSLPVEKKIGQLFFIGIGGATLDENSLRLFKEVAPGGVCLFARNIKTPEQTRELLLAVRENCEIELFLSLDEEGGVVDRLRRIIEPLPAASSIKTLTDARRLAEITAELLLALGFNMNFAPVADVITGTRKTFSNGLYSRAFGESKEQAAELAGAYLQTLQSNGVVGCLKHFPGLGASEIDSHEELPQVNLPEDELYATDLFSYREIFKSQTVGALMIAHAAYPQTELQETDANGKLTPSSLSYNFATKLLRDDMKFGGVAITDDLEMGAILKNYGIGEACKTALKAGVDMLAVCAEAANIRAGFAAVLEAVKNNEISEARIDESLRRIARLKNSLRKPAPFNLERWQSLSGEIAHFKAQLNDH